MSLLKKREREKKRAGIAVVKGQRAPSTKKPPPKEPPVLQSREVSA
jgi:hypothetical protein